MRVLLALAAAVFAPLSVQAVTIDTVLIGNPNNPFDVQPQGIFGTVSTTYRIGLTEVTNAQYVEFLNAVAASDPYHLYNTSMGGLDQGGIIQSGSDGSYTYAVKPDVLVEDPGGNYTYTYGDKPVVFVSWYDAIRFTNWLHNGQGSGDTETGAYTLGAVNPDNGVPINGDSIMHNVGAKWFLPTENEWYKAAYYDGSTSEYYNYPTGSDTVPNNNLPTADTGNSANFLEGINTTTGNLSYPYTSVGAYTLSASPYGTFDQAGNVWEWDETRDPTGMGLRFRRGGAWDSDATTLAGSNQGSFAATSERYSLGFRVASIPDPDGLAGDFNNDGTVDAADYVIWRKMGGSPEQYNEWRANFGMSSPGGGSFNVSAVPEPAGSVVALGGALAFFGRRRRSS